MIAGQSAIDEAPVRGESIPVAKGVGDKVFAGSINSNGMLSVRLTHTAADNTIARIIHLVEEAQASKAPTAAPRSFKYRTMRGRLATSIGSPTP